jgi:hypothetical protein
VDGLERYLMYGMEMWLERYPEYRLGLWLVLA